MSDDIATQTTKALDNVRLTVEAAGGSVHDIANWTILLTDADDVPAGFAAFTKYWDNSHPAPAITVQIVAGLTNPAFLVEIEAVAAIQP